MTEEEPRTRRPVKKEKEQMIVSQRTEEQRVERKQLPKHPLVQGVIFQKCSVHRGQSVRSVENKCYNPHFTHTYEMKGVLFMIRKWKTKCDNG